MQIIIKDIKTDKEEAKEIDINSFSIDYILFLINDIVKNKKECNQLSFDVLCEDLKIAYAKRIKENE